MDGVHMAILLCAAGLLAGPAPAQTVEPVQFELIGSSRLKILGARLIDEPKGAAIVGRVRRPTQWRGPVWGHLDVTVWTATGAVLAETTTRWPRTLGGRNGATSPYRADIGRIDTVSIARVAVRYHAASHAEGKPQ